MNIVKIIVYTFVGLLKPFLSKHHASTLLYHDIGDSELYLTVSPLQFKRQMKYLYKNNYTVISLQSLRDLIIAGKEIPQKTVVLTFDDGYISHLSTVLPILEEYKFHGTFFVATDFIGKMIDNSEKKPQEVMGIDELKTLESSLYADTQSHTCSHRELPTLGLSEKKKEIMEGKKVLENILSKTCNVFAYPRGVYDQESVSVVKEGGFIAAVTVDEGVVQKKSNPLTLPRNTINSVTSMPEFRSKLQGTSKFISFFHNKKISI